MPTPADCEECRAILDEFRNSLGEVERLKNEMGTGAEVVQERLEEGVEDDGTDFLEALHNNRQGFESYFNNPRCPGFARAMQRMLAHYNRTGHYISPRAFRT